MSYEFLMYICLDPTSNLPRNTYLERLGEYSKVPVDDKVPVYGDAFIFMMKPWPEESDHPKGAAYVHMTDQFAAGARAHISEKIPKLLRSLPKPEKNEEQ